MKIKIHNIVASSSLKQKIDLKKLAKLPNTEYDSKDFPALILKVKSCTTLVFANGKIILTGVKSVAELKPLVTRIAKIVKGVNEK